MRYPLDPLTYSETIGGVIEHERTQNILIQKMGELLENAMDSSETSEDDWYKESETLLKDLHSLKMWHESRRFNESVAKTQFPEKPGPAINALAEEESEVGEMTEEELARHFKEKRNNKKQKEQVKTLDKMTLEEIESWEKAQENSNDLYKIKARVANLAREGNMILTPQGEMLANTYTHVLKAFYDFADKLEDKNIKIQLTNLIRSHEGMPRNLIAAAGAGVTESKKERKK